MKRISTYILVLCAMAVLLLGCAKEQPVNIVQEDEEGSFKELPLNLCIGGLEQGNIATKLSATPEDEPNSQVTIENVWVVQFSGTTDGSVMARTPYYIGDYKNDGTSTVKLNTDVGGESLILFLANTFDPSLILGTNGKTTLAEFKKKYIPITSEASLFGISDGKYYQRLNGTTTATITTSTTEVGTVGEPVHLYRNMARLDINVKSSNAAIVINSVQLCSVPEYDYLYVNRSLSAPFPTLVQSTISYESVAYTSGADAGDKGKQFRFYVPANLRGTGTATTPGLKGNQAPMGATYVRIDATYTNSSLGDKEEQVRYYFHLGGDFGGESGAVDYNIEPNHLYTYNLNITQVGTPATDSRVEYFTDVDFTASSYERANCYMLHVPADDSKSVDFTFPVDKVNLFWDDATYSTKLDNPSEKIFVREYNENNYTAAHMVIGDDTPWVAELLWSDFDPTGGRIEILNINNLDEDGNAGSTPGAGKGTNASGTGKFKVRVKGGVSGNAVIGVRKKLHWSKAGDSGDIQCYVWSWHLWITDYNPDQNTGGFESGKYIYKVPGGKVFRISDAGNAIMDRSLGSTYNPVLPEFRSVLVDAEAKRDARLGLFYEFGRKDPFPNDRNIYIKGSGTPTNGFTDITNGTDAENILATDNKISKVKLSLLQRDRHAFLYTVNTILNVPFSINHPLTYIYEATFWNMGAASGEQGLTQNVYDRFNPISIDATILWQDPKAKDRTTANSLGIKKSVFDPCPGGWRLPEAGEISAVMGGWTMSQHVSPANYISPMEVTYSYGKYLWPQPMPSSPVGSDFDNASLFVFEGYLSFDNLSIQGYYHMDNRQAHVWSSTPSATQKTRAWAFNMIGDEISGAEHFRSQGYVIRCIKQ